MRLTTKPTQFSTGPAVRASATPTCSSCCCCCCCVASTASSSVLNGTVGARIARTNGLAEAKPRRLATLAPLVGIAGAIAGALLLGGINNDAAAAGAIAFGVGGLIAMVFASAKAAGSPKASIVWTIGLLVAFAFMFIAEVAAGLALILGIASQADALIGASVYLVVAIAVIIAAVFGRRKILATGPVKAANGESGLGPAES